MSDHSLTSGGAGDAERGGAVSDHRRVAEKDAAPSDGTLPCQGAITKGGCVRTGDHSE